MATVHFYEKPGCVNNTRQKQLLLNAGYQLIVHNLLEQPWAEQKSLLRTFFGNLAVADWFNRSAPAVKNGLVVPEHLSEQQAIAAMVADPLLIRRPLLEVDGRRRAGFDSTVLESWLGVSAVQADLETCPKTQTSTTCQP